VSSIVAPFDLEGARLGDLVLWFCRGDAESFVECCDFGDEGRVGDCGGEVGELDPAAKLGILRELAD
jgi:hypothetical protein